MIVTFFKVLTSIRRAFCSLDSTCIFSDKEVCCSNDVSTLTYVGRMKTKKYEPFHCCHADYLTNIVSFIDISSYKLSSWLKYCSGQHIKVMLLIVWIKYCMRSYFTVTTGFRVLFAICKDKLIRQNALTIQIKTRASHIWLKVKQGHNSHYIHFLEALSHKEWFTNLAQQQAQSCVAGLEPSSSKAHIFVPMLSSDIEHDYLNQLCPTRGPHAPHSKIFCGPV